LVVSALYLDFLPYMPEPFLLASCSCYARVALAGDCRRTPTPPDQRGRHTLTTHLSHARSSRYRLALAALPSSASAEARLLPRATAASALHSSASVRYLQSTASRTLDDHIKFRSVASNASSCVSAALLCQCAVPAKHSKQNIG
jgi:hypothetical protein